MQGRALVAGSAKGEILLSPAPLSFWGGYDPATGEIIDRRHPLSGRNAKGRVLALPSTRGSSTTTAVLLEAVRKGTAPAALLTTGVDSFLVLASLVAEEMYGKPIPIVMISKAEMLGLRDGAVVVVGEDGTVSVST